jgi:predicted enzyme related to lactoylglutathione lyase
MKTPPKRPIPKSKPYKNFINWFEIPAANFERAVNFYNKIYQIEMECNSMGGYSMAFFPVENGVGGAIIYGEGSFPSDKGPLLYLNGGNDLNTILSRVEDAGGTILLNKQLINEEAGYFALFTDTEGNKLALHSKS